MSNMSYCRFENTLHDLRDCLDALQEYSASELMEDASQYEKPAIVQLIEVCKEIADDYDAADFEKARIKSEQYED